MFPVRTCHVFQAVTQYLSEVTFHKIPIMEKVSLQELNHFNTLLFKTECLWQYFFFELSSCCLSSGATSGSSGHPHRVKEAGTRGRKRGEGWGKEDTCLGLPCLHEKVKDRKMALLVSSLFVFLKRLVYPL